MARTDFDRSKILQSLKQLTYSSYESATETKSSGDQSETTPCLSPELTLFSVTAFADIFACCLRLLTAVVEPFMILPMMLTLISLPCNPISLHFTFLVLMVMVWLFRRFAPKVSHVTGMISSPCFGALCRPGLYYKKSAVAEQLLQRCPIISSSAAIAGDLPILNVGGAYPPEVESIKYSTPWMLSGDLRTLLPFLLNQPPNVDYFRRWVRVPLNDSNPVSNGTSMHHEAVALDFCISSASGSKIAIILLAGLTGGSKEGYALDIVNRAKAKGWDCFVMLGRGLANTPVRSEVFFHGARYSDLVEAAKVVRSSLPMGTRLFAVGISMGGIIISNALIKGDLSEYVDAAVSVSGCFDIFNNTEFDHSRKVWQPLLTRSLKDNFVSPPKNHHILRKVFGEQCDLQGLVDNVIDVFDFDCIMVTHMHGFKSVEEYYKAMRSSEQEILDPSSKGVELVTTATEEVVTGVDKEKGKEEAATTPGRLRLKKPLLALHAMDDPISHVDTMPCTNPDLTTPEKIDNFYCLITERGGHVGWPVGLLPWENGFLFSSSVALEFIEAVSLTLDQKK